MTLSPLLISPYSPIVSPTRRSSLVCSCSVASSSFSDAREGLAESIMGGHFTRSALWLSIFCWGHYGERCKSARRERSINPIRLYGEHFLKHDRRARAEGPPRGRR